MVAAKKMSAHAPQETIAAPAVPVAQSAPLSAQVQELKVTGHLMALPPGLFCVINEARPGAALHNGLPGVRLSVPPLGGEDVEITGFRADGWLNAEGDAALVRVKNKPSQVLVTIYQLENMPDASPKLKVQQLFEGTPAPHNAAPAPLPAAPAVAAAPKTGDVVAHIQTRGDVGAAFGTWLGEPNSKNWIEGFTITAPEGIAPSDFTYQAVLGRGWLSPWVEAGEYCGSRGMALPLLGLRIRLTGKAAEQYEVSCSAAFIGGAQAGPVGNDETCEAETLAPLEALQVTLIPRKKKLDSKAKK